MTWLLGAISARVRRIIAGTGLVALFGLLMRWMGGRDAKAKRRADDAESYIKERSKIDDEVSGIGGNDADNIKRLRAIANRRGAGKN